MIVTVRLVVLVVEEYLYGTISTKGTLLAVECHIHDITVLK